MLSGRLTYEATRKGTVARIADELIIHPQPSHHTPRIRLLKQNKSPFKWRHFEPAIILLCARWYCRYSLSYRGLEEMMRERGLSVDHVTTFRWVQRSAPEINRRVRPRLKMSGTSYRLDETYVKVGKEWKYLYRAVAWRKAWSSLSLPQLISRNRAVMIIQTFRGYVSHATSVARPIQALTPVSSLMVKGHAIRDVRKIQGSTNFKKQIRKWGHANVTGETGAGARPFVGGRTRLKKSADFVSISPSRPTDSTAQSLQAESLPTLKKNSPRA